MCSRCLRSSSSLRAVGFLAVVCLAVSCQRPAETLLPSQGGKLVVGNRQSDLQPGPPTPVREVKNPFDGNEEGIAEGKRLYSTFNCAGCHAGGGGAIGPSFMDDEWIYGSSSSNIFWTVMEGRPQGMPAFGGRIAEDQVWRIAAYIRSLSGLHERERKSGAGK
jgi:cytochrome c oxidase cbb3-type subunit 3